MTIECTDHSRNLVDLFDDGDWGVCFSQIVLRASDLAGRSDDVTVRSWPGVSAELVVLSGNKTNALPELYRLAIKNRKRAAQMIELAVTNTNRELRTVRHGAYSQILAPSALPGTELFATRNLIFGGGVTGSDVLLLHTERAVFAARFSQIRDLLLMAVANRLSGVLRGAWGSGQFRGLTESDWYEHCLDDYDLFALGAEFLAVAEDPF